MSGGKHGGAHGTDYYHSDQILIIVRTHPHMWFTLPHINDVIRAIYRGQVGVLAIAAVLSLQSVGNTQI
jgi:hypothetical protein